MSRILLLLENKENARLLADLLGRRHELILEAPADGALDIPWDLAIVDGPSLRAKSSFLAARKQEEEPVLLPVLLVTTRQNVSVYTGPVFKIVDEIVLTPVEKVELIARVEMLLRARRLSLELRLRKDDVEAFIDAMTHDLRAPLRAVTGFAEAMAEDQSSRLDATGRHQLDRIQSAVGEMWELIESLVEFSRIGRKGIRLKRVDLDETVGACIDQMRGEIDARGASVEIQGRLGHVEADPSLLRIGICNLISNGIKYVAEGVTPRMDIWTTTSTSGNTLCLLFRDNGIGLKADDQQRIFAPFVRLHGVEDYPGLGLGLSATKRVVEIMGGQLGVTSSIGDGSTFWMELTTGGAE